MNNNAIPMEKFFQPGFKVKPLVHVGSQTLKFWRDDPEEQAFEGFFLVGAHGKDVGVVRDMDPKYLDYWSRLTDGSKVVNLIGLDPKKYLSQAILGSPEAIQMVKKQIASGAKLMPFLVTDLEEKLADTLGISLHGSAQFSNIFGTKSGIRKLIEEANIPMPSGYICTTYDQVEKAINTLAKQFDEVVVKHDNSASGYGSKKINTKNLSSLKQTLDKIVYGKFVDGKETVVIEGWVKNGASLCAHIEILSGQQPIICAGWQQLINTDGVSYMGAGPLMISSEATESFMNEVDKLAKALAKKGAVGSFGPDFLIISGEEKNLDPETCILVELNARVPVTAYPLELIKHIKGNIGSGFCSSHIKLSSSCTFTEIADALNRENLLITRRDKQAKGVVPFNVGMLPWKLFDIVAMADSWEETSSIIHRVRKLFGKSA